MSYAIWTFAFAISNSLCDLQEVLIWRRIAALGWGSAFSLMLHFMLILTEKQKLLAAPKTYVALYLPAAYYHFGFRPGSRIWPTPSII